MTIGCSRGDDAIERMNERFSLVVSCEHGGNQVPAPYARLFESADGRAALASHRGWDPGSLDIGRSFAGRLGAPLVVQRVTRLLVECNRSLDHAALFSEFSRTLTEGERAEVIERYWRSHRCEVRRLVDGAPPDRVVLHVGVHTFAPLLDGRERSTDVGLLYDPQRDAERELVSAWKAELVRVLGADGLRVHRNRPYRGWTDGLTTTLRRELSASLYLGIELEVSQRLGSAAARIGSVCASALRTALGSGRAVDPL